VGVPAAEGASEAFLDGVVGRLLAPRQRRHRADVARIALAVEGPETAADVVHTARVAHAGTFVERADAPRGGHHGPSVPTPEGLLHAWRISGSARTKVELAVRRLRSRVEEEGGGVEALTAAGDEAVAPSDVVDACNALGLFGGRRLVLVTAVEAWK